MKKKILKFIRDEKGDGLWGSLITVLIVLIICLISRDVIGYNMIKSNIKTAANETLQIMKVENGADYTTRSKFDNLLRRFNIDPSNVTFTATPKTVQRGDSVEITATRPYKVTSLKVIGVDFTTIINVRVSGLAHKYIREGG